MIKCWELLNLMWVYLSRYYNDSLREAMPFELVTIVLMGSLRSYALSPSLNHTVFPLR